MAAAVQEFFDVLQSFRINEALWNAHRILFVTDHDGRRKVTSIGRIKDVILVARTFFRVIFANDTFDTAQDIMNSFEAKNVVPLRMPGACDSDQASRSEMYL